MLQFINTHTDTIFLMLGSDCNLKCRYCLQSPNCPPVQSRNGINPEVIEFILAAADNNLENKPLLIQGYGGEPLLHWDVLRSVFDRIKHHPQIQFSVISNGTLLTDFMVDYFNNHQISFTLSWDGENTEYLRGVDVLKDPKLVERFCRLEKMSLSTVVNKYATPKQVIDTAIPFMKHYFNSTGNHCSINFDLIFDTGIEDKDLLMVNCNQVYDEMTILATELKKRLNNEDHNDYYAHHASMLFGSLLQTVKNKTTFNQESSCCKNGYHVHNVDLDGNLYRCHNTNEVIGNITIPYYEYHNKVVSLDTTKAKAVKCKDCPVVTLCKYGCPLISLDKLDDRYCDLRKAMYSPIIQLLLDLGTNVSLDNPLE